MGHPNIKELEQELLSWELLEQLPQEIDGFTLVKGGGIDGRILTIASYVNQMEHCSLDIVYTSETFDYLVVKKIGLNQLRDINYFYRDRDKFGKCILENLQQLLSEINPSIKQTRDPIVEETGVLEWDYSQILPKTIKEFELFITPSNPVDYINGSVILIDYSNFAKETQLIVFYNRFRNEIFAETKKAMIPGITHEFDCCTVKELESLLIEKLERTLSELEKT